MRSSVFENQAKMCPKTQILTFKWPSLAYQWKVKAEFREENLYSGGGVTGLNPKYPRLCLGIQLFKEDNLVFQKYTPPPKKKNLFIIRSINDGAKWWEYIQVFFPHLYNGTQTCELYILSLWSNLITIIDMFLHHRFFKN